MKDLSENIDEYEFIDDVKNVSKKGLGSVSEREEEFENLVELFKGENEDNYPLAEAMAENYADLFKSKYNLDMQYVSVFKYFFKRYKKYIPLMIIYNYSNGYFNMYSDMVHTELRTTYLEIDVSELLTSPKKDFLSKQRKYIADLNFEDPNLPRDAKDFEVEELYESCSKHLFEKGSGVPFKMSVDDAMMLFKLYYELSNTIYLKKCIIRDAVNEFSFRSSFYHRSFKLRVRKFVKMDSGTQGMGSVDDKINKDFDFDRDVIQFLEELKKDFPNTFKIKQKRNRDKDSITREGIVCYFSHYDYKIGGNYSVRFPPIDSENEWDMEFYTVYDDDARNPERNTLFKYFRSDFISKLLIHNKNYKNDYLREKYVPMLLRNNGKEDILNAISEDCIRNLQKLRF